MQVVQHELEGLRREWPGLTPRPTRDVATFKDLINNEKVTHTTAIVHLNGLQASVVWGLGAEGKRLL